MIPGPFSVQREGPMCLICIWSPAGKTKHSEQSSPQEAWAFQPELLLAACGSDTGAAMDLAVTVATAALLTCSAYNAIAHGSFLLSRVWSEPTQMALRCFQWCKWGSQVWNKAVTSWSAGDLRQKALVRVTALEKVMLAVLMGPTKASADLWNRILTHLL